MKRISITTVEFGTITVNAAMLIAIIPLSQNTCQVTFPLMNFTVNQSLEAVEAIFFT